MLLKSLFQFKVAFSVIICLITFRKIIITIFTKLFQMSQIEAIIQLNCAGRTDSEIIKFLKEAKSIVYNFVKIFKYS